MQYHSNKKGAQILFRGEGKLVSKWQRKDKAKELRVFPSILHENELQLDGQQH